MHKQADIAVYSRDRSLQLVIEVRNGYGDSPEWAREVRQMLLSNEAVPSSPYFLMALTNQLYLWTPTTRNDYGALPEHAIDTLAALAAYIGWLERPLETLGKEAFESVIASWIQDLMYADPSRRADPSLSWFFDSGLYSAIQRGGLEVELVV